MRQQVFQGVPSFIHRLADERRMECSELARLPREERRESDCIPLGLTKVHRNFVFAFFFPPGRKRATHYKTVHQKEKKEMPQPRRQSESTRGAASHRRPPPPSDLYEVLELDREASGDAVRRQYKKLALKWHPDKNPDDREYCEHMFKAVSRAYEVLSNDEMRRRYDAYGLAGLEEGAADDDSFVRRGHRERSRAAPSFDDFFFGGDVFGRTRGGPFAFHDPFELFNMLFDDDFFGESRGRRRGGSDFFFGGHGFMDDAFDSFFSPCPRRSSGRHDMFSMMMGGGFPSLLMNGGPALGGAGTMRSVTSQTTIVNGRRVTRKITRTQHPDGTVTEDVEESVADHPQYSTGRIRENPPAGHAIRW